MDTTLKRYAPSVLSFLVLVVGGLQAVIATGVTPVAIAQLGVLVLTTFTTWLVPLVDAPWRGRLKTGAELVGVVIVIALPYIAAGGITTAEVLVAVIAVMKAGAAQFGVEIRTDPKLAPAAGPDHRADS